MITKVVIELFGDEKSIEKIELTSDEWEFLKEHIIENSITFHESCLIDFSELAIDLVNENFNPEKNQSVFEKNVNIFMKLKKLGINVNTLDHQNKKEINYG
jgi:hypothetical protein